MLLALAALVVLTAQSGYGANEAELTKTVTGMENKVHALTRQLMLQQFFIEEKIRGDGDSGIKRIRLYNVGTRPYYSYSHTGGSILAIHDHADYDRLIGTGEFSAVLNGVEFRTRHNDYKLHMPHRTKKDFHAYEPVPLPEVPPQVKAKKTLPEKIQEMREFFKAWATQNVKHRDYRKYFPAVLCYLEGAWTTNTKTLEEPFQSDRHFIDAKNWFDLQNKVRFTAYNGRKSLQENYAYLPTTIIDINQNNEPVFAQWNYRIFCHPIKDDLPLDRLRVAEELQLRMANKYTIQKYKESRRARFTLSPTTGKYPSGERYYQTGLLDKIMAQIPGKDNYPANLRDTAFESLALDYNTNQPLNTGYYHRWFKAQEKGAMGSQRRHRGFSDSTIFMAQNSQPRIASMTLDDCKRVNGKNVCKKYEQRWSYAIPLEIIYLTPLMQWNPYGLVKKDYKDKSVEAGGRNGGLTKEKAYNGIRQNKWFITPVEFYSGGEVKKDAADTSRGGVGVLDQNGNLRAVKAAGVRVFMPNIPGVGVLRQRYPIPAIHAEGSAAYKEISALTDLVMGQEQYKSIFRTPPIGTGSTAPIKSVRTYELEMSISTKSPPGRHLHRVILSENEMKELMSGKTLNKNTNTANSHSHNIGIRYDKNQTKSKYIIATCDGKPTCWDGHDKYLKLKN